MKDRPQFADDWAKPGTPCIVGPTGDLYMEYDARDFIEVPCEIVQRNKSGKIMVRLVSDPKRTYSVPARNIILPL